MWALATSRQAAAGARPATRLRHLTAALRASSCSAAASSAADLRYISQPASDAAGQAAAPQAFPVELYPPIEPYATGCAFLPARAPCNFDAATASPRTAQATMRVRTSTRGGALTQLRRCRTPLQHCPTGASRLRGRALCRAQAPAGRRRTRDLLGAVWQSGPLRTCR